MGPYLLIGAACCCLIIGVFSSWDFAFAARRTHLRHTVVDASVPVLMFTLGVGLLWGAALLGAA
jgi:hypothetical protein